MDQARPVVYDPQPPQWLPKTHRSADAGYLGYDPPKPGQEEDVLSKDNVSAGFMAPKLVSAETYSAQGNMSKHLADDNSLHDLESLMDQVFARKAQYAPVISQSTFKIPPRVAVPESKRRAWFAELANPEIPLHKLGKSVPHGAKGHDLLDLLHSYNVALTRAVWCLRVFGANETAGLRKLSTYNPTQYSIEWTNVVTSYLKKQITEVTLPTATRLGISSKSTFRGVFSDNDSRQKWVSRFTYSIQLLRSFYDEGMVDSYTFLSWAVQQMGVSSLAQAGLVLRLTDEYLEDLLTLRVLTQPYMDACLIKLSEVEAASLPSLSFLQTDLEMHVRKAFLAQIDAFVSPRMWTRHHALLQDILCQDIATITSNASAAKEIELQLVILNGVESVEHRIQNLLFHNEAPAGPTDLYAAMLVVLGLNASTTSMDLRATAMQLFGERLDDDRRFSQKLELLLSWGTTSSQFGSQRPYVVVSILDHWRVVTNERARRRNTLPSYEPLQDRIFEWLDNTELVEDKETIPAVASLLGKLVEKSLFSFDRYLERLIARGEQGLAVDNKNFSRHRELIRTIPLSGSDPAVLRRRKMILYGPRARETPDDIEERTILLELRTLLPALFESPSITIPSPVSKEEILIICPSLRTASLFNVSRVVRRWVEPKINAFLSDQDSADTAARTDMCTIVLILMHYAQRFESMLEVCVKMLHFYSSRRMLSVAALTLHHYMEVWTATGNVGVVQEAISDVHSAIAAHNLPADRSVLRLLNELQPGSAEGTTTLQRSATNFSPIPRVLPEILLLLQDTRSDAPAILATTLWSKYGTLPNWVLSVWDNIVASLRQIPGMTINEDDRVTYALRYASCLLHIDALLPLPMDLSEWFTGSGRNELIALDASVWNLLNQVLLYLCLHGSLVISDVLAYVVYSIWASAAEVTSESEGQSAACPSLAVNQLFKLLVLDTELPSHPILPITLSNAYSLHSFRRDVYRHPCFVQLLWGVKALSMMSQSMHLPSNVCESSEKLHATIVADSLFRQGLYAEHERLRPTSSRAPSLQPGEDDMVVDSTVAKAGRVSLFHTIRSYLSTDALCDIRDVDAVDLASSPWKLAMSGVALQMALQQASSPDGSLSSAAHVVLDGILAKFLHKSMTAEEADFIAGVTRGADGTVAKKFIDLGVNCISQNIGNVSPSSLSANDEDFNSAAEILHLLTRVLQPLRSRETLLPEIANDVQNEFIITFIDVFVKTADALEQPPPGDDSSTSSAQLEDWAVFLARLLQFNLGLPGAWTSAMKENALKLCQTTFRLVLDFADGPRQHPVAFAALIDTFYFMVDEANIEVAGTDLARFYPLPNQLGLFKDAYSEYKTKLLALLPSIRRSTEADGLAIAFRDASGATVLQQLLQRQPWEWIEHPGDQAAPNQTDYDKKTMLPAIRNAGSLSLELFEARGTVDSIHSASAERDTALTWMFEDGLAADVIFARALRDVRAEDVLVGGVEDDPSALGHLARAMPTTPGATGPGSRPGSRGTSPASSSHSRLSVLPPPPGTVVGVHSMPGSASSARFSPAQLPFSRGSVPASGTDTPQGSTNVLPSVHSMRRTSKRKAPSEDEDDEIQIIDQPSLALRDKKGKGKSGTKGKTTKK